MVSQPRATAASKSSASSRWVTGERGGGYWSIALTLGVTFVLSFAYLYHKQRSEAPPAPLAQASTEAPHPSQIPPPPPQLAPSPAPAGAPTSPARPMIVAQSGDASSGPPDSAQLNPVPVLLRMHRAGGGRIEGSLKSLSENPLTVTLVSRNRQGDVTSETQLALAPLGIKAFGTDEGMGLQSGDLIVVRSQGYKDRETSAP